MGGAAGHVSQIWEVHELTFRELKDIIIKSFCGELENITEKLDGQNILITYKKGKILIARSTKHLKNFGDTAMDINDAKKYFSTRGNPPSVEKAYITAIEDFQNLFEISKLKILEEGKKWLNIEILYKDNENVIPYGINQLRIHNIRELDENGKIINLSNKGLEDINNSQIENKTFSIEKTNFLTIKYIVNFDEKYKKLLYKLQSLEMKDDDSIEDYIESQILNFIHRSFKDFNLSEKFIETLGKRWGRGDKSTPINKLLKDQPKEIQLYVRYADKIIKRKKEKIIEPLVDIFSNLGVIILKNLDGLVTLNEKQSTEKIKNKLANAINYFESLDDTEKIIKIIEYFKKFKKMGGVDSIVPVEGIVFEYHGKLLKLTGSFTPLLRIIGFHKFNPKKV